MEKTGGIANPGRIDAKHIDVLDGIRAFAVFGVLWFHFWQQNWISPNFKLPILASFGLSTTVQLEMFARGGFLFVDWLLFLSAFCLFLPYARAALNGEAQPDTRRFYIKRVARIVPSYYLAVLVILFAFAIPSGLYASVKDCLGDVLPTLTFTQTFFPRVLIYTKINGVLWTAAVEMQFYLVFPLLARAFQKKPVYTYLGMLLVAVLYLRGFALRDTESIRLTVNQLPAFFGVFANGMAFAYLFVWLAGRLRRGRQLSLLAFAGLIAGIALLIGMLKQAPSTNPIQLWQAQNRFALSLVFALITMSAALTFAAVRALFSNPVMRFLSAISYNIYIWHQWIAVRFKEWRIPYWSGENPPNMTGDTAWQWSYTALIFAATFAAAIFATYAVERPLAKRILAAARMKREPMISITPIEEKTDTPEKTDTLIEEETDAPENGEETKQETTRKDPEHTK